MQSEREVNSQYDSMNDQEKSRDYADSEMATSNAAGRLPVSVREILDDYYDASSFGSSSMDAMSAANAVLAEVGGDLPLQDEKFSTVDNFSKTQGAQGNECDTFPPDEQPSPDGKNASDGLGSLVSRFQGSPFIRRGEPQDPAGKDDFIHIRSHSITPEPSKMIDRLETKICNKNEDSGNPCIDLFCDDRINEPGDVQSDEDNNLDVVNVKHIRDKNEFSPGRHGINGTLQISVESVISEAPNKQSHLSSESNPVVSSTKPGCLTKKPFLKKGARKEPSALHRFESNHQNEPIHTHSQTNRTDNLKKERLKELERMQEKQREDLKKRLERRQCAREEIRRRKKGCKVQVVGNVSKEGKTNESKTGSRSKDGDDSSEESSSETDVGSDLDSDSDSSCDRPNERCQENSKSEVKSTPQRCPSRKGKNSIIYNRDIDVKRERAISKKKGGHSPNPNLRNRLKSKQCKSSGTELKSPELEEQWQVIKSMRKRQEAALRSAEMEREQVRIQIYRVYDVSRSHDIIHKSISPNDRQDHGLPRNVKSLQSGENNSVP